MRNILMLLMSGLAGMSARSGDVDDSVCNVLYAALSSGE